VVLGLFTIVLVGATRELVNEGLTSSRRQLRAYLGIVGVYVLDVSSLGTDLRNFVVSTTDVLPGMTSFRGRVCSGFAPLPNLGPPGLRVSGLAVDLPRTLDQAGD